MKKSILVVVAHSDDESIGMAGTIRKHINCGGEVNIISMTDGVGSRNDSNKEAILARKTSAKKASQILGFRWGKSYSFEDNKLDSYPLIEIIKTIEISKDKYKPQIVYTHSGADLNIDHRVVLNAVLTSFRPQPNESCKEIRLFEVASATDYGNPSVTGKFMPNLFISIEDTWEYKLKSLESYNLEMRNYPHSRSINAIKNLAKIRGNQVGYEYAEAFEVIRKLED
ncbi:PIG-L family deacetylase [Gammaproteobacteria bacterium]|nr:PIG-L family deacetylase [Gammaproteobacteria bacterium]